MKTLQKTLVALLLVAAAAANADPVVVVSANSTLQRITRDDAINIFMGRYRGLASGGTALPIDQPETSALRAEFYRKLVNKEIHEINAYWSRLVFSGRTAPPLQAASPAEVTAWLDSNPLAVAYIERTQVGKRQRIVLEFPQ